MMKRLQMRAHLSAWKLLDRATPKRMLVRKGRPARRSIALTFDDGPEDLTRAYLDCLDEFSATATFFVNGERCIDRPDTVREIAARGHALGVHGYTHRPFPDLSVGDIAVELSATAKALPPTAFPMVRPPYGNLSPASVAACIRAGFSIVMWSVDSNDGFCKDAASVLENVGSHRLQPGDIVLMHEGQPWTLEALPYILADLSSAGYALVSVPELVGAPL